MEMITLEEFLREGCLDYYKIIKPRARDPRLWVLDSVTLYKIDTCWSWTVLGFVRENVSAITVRSNGHVEICTLDKATATWGFEIEDSNNNPAQDFINVVLQRYPDIKTSGPQCDNYASYRLLSKGKCIRGV